VNPISSSSEQSDEQNSRPRGLSDIGFRIAYLLRVPREIYVDDDGKPYRELHVADLMGNSTPFVTGDKITISQ